MAKQKTWGEQRMAQIIQDARDKYGKGWDHMSEDQRQCYIDSRILALLLGQAGEQYAPAHELARQVYAAQQAG